MESSLRNLCRDIFVVESLLWNLSCGIFVVAHVVVGPFVVESFVLESSLWSLRC